MKPQFNIFFRLTDEVRGCSFLDDYEVECWFNSNGTVKVDKVSRFCERFQITKDITVDILPCEKEFKKLREELEDWFIGHQFEQLPKPKIYDLEIA